jgi:hypothetical protein
MENTHQLAQLVVALAARATQDGEHVGDVGIEERFAERALADHAGGAEEEEVHAAIFYQRGGDGEREAS